MLKTLRRAQPYRQTADLLDYGLRRREKFRAIECHDAAVDAHIDRVKRTLALLRYSTPLRRVHTRRGRGTALPGDHYSRSSLFPDAEIHRQGRDPLRRWPLALTNVFNVVSERDGYRLGRVVPPGVIAEPGQPHG